MISPISQMQITFPVTIRRDVIREESLYLSLSCRLLETRLLQRMRFAYGDIYTVAVSYFPSGPVGRSHHQFIQL